MNKSDFEERIFNFIIILVIITGIMYLISFKIIKEMTKNHNEILQKLDKQEQIIHVLHSEQMMYHTDKKKFMEMIGK